MSKTYDVLVDEGNGQRFKIYNQPESIVRELGLLRTVEDRGSFRTQKVPDSSVQGLTIAVADNQSIPERTTLQSIWDEQHYARGAGDPPKRTDYDPKPAEFHVKVDRVTGTVDQER